MWPWGLQYAQKPICIVSLWSGQLTCNSVAWQARELLHVNCVSQAFSRLKLLLLDDFEEDFICQKVCEKLNVSDIVQNVLEIELYGKGRILAGWTCDLPSRHGGDVVCICIIYRNRREARISSMSNLELRYMIWSRHEASVFYKYYDCMINEELGRREMRDIFTAIRYNDDFVPMLSVQRTSYELKWGGNEKWSGEPIYVLYSCNITDIGEMSCEKHSKNVNIQCDKVVVSWIYLRSTWLWACSDIENNGSWGRVKTASGKRRKRG